MDTIYGNLEYCFDGVPVIRGYCSAKVLLAHSKAHPAYQRNAEDQHVKDIKNFISSSSLKFMPEIVLAYDYTGIYQDPNQWLPTSFHDPIDFLYHGKKRGISPYFTDPITRVKFSALQTGTKALTTIKIELPNKSLLNDGVVFRRIDGNHRLSAFEETDLKNTMVSYCIVMLYSESNVPKKREKDEMEIFHNINAKAKPLTPIEQYRGLFELFTVDELSIYGREFSITKAYLDKHHNLRLSNLSNFMVNGSETVLNCVKYLLDNGVDVTEDDIADVFSKLEYTYFSDCNAIRNCKSTEAIIPYVYYCIIGKRQKNPQLDAYHAWFVKNKLYNVADFDPKSMIETFDTIYKIRQKQIFVAMPFRDDLLFVYKAICEVVEKINRENGLELEIPVRIDKQITGFSYDIVEEILEKIKNAGLLIADLTDQNANVYYEAGYAQGLLKAKLGNTAEILYLLSNPEEPDKPFDAAKFDVNHYKMIPYKNAGNGVDQLKKDLEKELKAFYCI